MVAPALSSFKRLLNLSPLISPFAARVPIKNIIALPCSSVLMVRSYLPNLRSIRDDGSKFFPNTFSSGGLILVIGMSYGLNLAFKVVASFKCVVRDGILPAANALKSASNTPFSLAAAENKFTAS